MGLLPAGVLHGAEVAPHKRMPNKSVPGERLWRFAKRSFCEFPASFLTEL